MELTDSYLIDNFATREHWRGPLLLMAMAGVAFLFFRSGLTKVAGCLLIVARLVAMPLTGTEWLILFSVALMAAVAVALRRHDPDAAPTAPDIAEAPEPDDD